MKNTRKMISIVLAAMLLISAVVTVFAPFVIKERKADKV